MPGRICCARRDAGALTYFAVDFHVPARLFDKTIDLAQAQARTLPGIFCREKGFESVIENVAGHPGASVRHANDDILSWRKLRIYPAIVVS